MLETLKKAKI